MKKVKIRIGIKAHGGGNSQFTAESDLATARTPATPLQTVIVAAEHLARAAEIFNGEGDALVDAVREAVQQVRIAK